MTDKGERVALVGVAHEPRTDDPGDCNTESATGWTELMQPGIEDDSMKTRVVTASGWSCWSYTLILDLQIEGVPVEALIDTGSQSTIISRTTLHASAKYLKENGHPLLEEPTVKL